MVCGSSRGIGKAVAIELAKLGANIILVARDESKLKEVVIQLDISSGQKHTYLVVDFNHPEELKSKVAGLLAAHHPIHILINNTGGPAPGTILVAAPEQLISAFSNHILCNQILVQAIVPGMKEAGFGRIVNIISTSVKQPIPGLGVSNTIRGAVASWSKTLAGELGAFGITVNNVLPGYTRTDRLNSLIERKTKQSGKSIQEVEKDMIQDIPTNRFGQPEEIASAVAFLVSEAAGYVNGINLPVDGGRLSCL